MENLRGYEDAALPIAPFSVLVGPNNHGKSSILRVADWLLNAAKDDVLRGDRPLSPEDMALLLPANQTKHRARRFSLIVRFDDARKARTFAGEGHVAQLRLSVEKAARVARVNCGPPRRNEQHDPRALALLERIRECCRFVLVPAARDARSERFRAALESRLRSLLLDKFGHRKQAGAPAEYRKATDILRKLEQMPCVPT